MTLGRRQLLSVAPALALMIAGGTAAAATANVDGPNSLVTFSPGVTWTFGALSGLHFGGEISVMYARFGSSSALGIGAATGGNPDSWYLELQSMATLGGGRHGVLLGVNPGLVVEWATTTRTGAQLTLWGEYIYAGDGGDAMPFMLPLIPFVRGELFAHQTFWTWGLMLKVPLPISGVDWRWL